MSATDITTPRYFTREEVMFVFQVGSSTVDEWQAQGNLPHFKKGRVVRFPADGVLAWARSRTVGSYADGAPGRQLRADELEQFWQHIERMVGVTVNQILQRLEHPNHLEAA